MGNALSLAAVSRILRQIVEGNVTRYGLDGYAGADVAVTTTPPLEEDDRIRINIFLYRAVESAPLKNQTLPTRDSQGRPINQPILSLDLHYAVTAYATGDQQSEMMLGCAMQALHETPVLDRALIHQVLTLDAGANSLVESRLAEQIENVRIRHRNLPEEAFTRLWSTFHVPYRLTAFYEVSVALIQSDLETRATMPVFARPVPISHGTLGPWTPTLFQANPSTAMAGETVTLAGIGLTGQNVQIQVESRRGSVPIPPLNVPPDSASEGAIDFDVPDSWPAGVYELRVTLEPVGGGNRRPSNPIAFTVAPSFTVNAVNRNGALPGLVTLELTVVPEVQTAQPVALILGSQIITGPPTLAPTGTLTFANIDIPAGTFATRLRVDGIESPWINRATQPPSILPEALLDIP